MRYVFIVQGEGRGHLTQAISMERLLRESGHEVAAVLVGKSPARKLPAFFAGTIKAPVEMFESFNFVPSASNRKASSLKTGLYNILHMAGFIPSIRFISRRLKEIRPDVVVNFYDILGTMGYRLSGLKAPMVCLGHQFLFLHKDFRFPRTGYSGHYALNMFTRMVAWGSAKILALSFRPMPDDQKRRIKVVPPLLRPAVLDLRPASGADDPAVRDGGYIHGYMLNAGFSQDVLEWHAAHPEVPLRFFWDRADEAPVKVVDETLSFYYLNDEEFLRQMAGCHAYASTAGFESVCEAMYLGKPLLMVPSHIEQKCNAYDATEGCRMASGRDSVPSGGSEASGGDKAPGGGGEAPCGGSKASGGDKAPGGGGEAPCPAVASDRFDLDLLLHFADNEFVADKSFPDWARSADSVFLKELTFS